MDEKMLTPSLHEHTPGLMSQLATELVIHILSHVEVADILAVLSTCRKWHTLAKHFVPDVLVTTIVQGHRVPRVYRYRIERSRVEERLCMEISKLGKKISKLRTQDSQIMTHSGKEGNYTGLQEILRHVRHGMVKYLLMTGARVDDTLTFIELDASAMGKEIARALVHIGAAGVYVKYPVSAPPPPLVGAAAPVTDPKVLPKRPCIAFSCHEPAVFFQIDKVGMATYHLTFQPEESVQDKILLKEAYISYEHSRSACWGFLDDGTPIPEKKYFADASYDAKTKIFTGTIFWPQGWRFRSRWEYTAKFDDALFKIESGKVDEYDMQGNHVDTIGFGEDLGLDYTRLLRVRDLLTYMP